MADRPTPDQIGRIDDLKTRLGLSGMAEFYRWRKILGRPVMVITQMTSAEAELVIAALEADNDQPALPGMETNHG